MRFYVIFSIQLNAVALIIRQFQYRKSLVPIQIDLFFVHIEYIFTKRALNRFYRLYRLLRFQIEVKPKTFVTHIDSINKPQH